MVRFLLLVGGWLLPRSRRARWREESLALLLDVHGWRRWRYTCDLLVKVPVLAWQLHDGESMRWPTPGAVLGGLGLLLAALAVPGAFVFAQVLGEDSAEALLLLAPIGLAAFITGRTVRTARRLSTAVPVVVFGAFGPLVGVAVLASERLVPGSASPVVTFVGYSALAGPGAWLVISSWLSTRRREGPVVRHAFGFVAGGAFVFDVAGLVWQMLSNGNVPMPVPLLMVLGLFAFLATFPVWAAWTGVGLIAASVRPPTRAEDAAG